MVRPAIPSVFDPFVGELWLVAAPQRGVIQLPGAIIYSLLAGRSCNARLGMGEQGLGSSGVPQFAESGALVA